MLALHEARRCVPIEGFFRIHARIVTVGGEWIEVIAHRREDVARAREILARLGDGEVTLDEHTRELTVHSRGGAQALVGVVRELDEAGIQIDDIGLRRPTLDDVFLALTGHAAADNAPEAAEGTRSPGRTA